MCINKTLGIYSAEMIHLESWSGSLSCIFDTFADFGDL